MQLLVAKPLGLDRSHGSQHVVAIVSGTAVSLLDQVELLDQGQSSGILYVTAIDHIGQRANPLAGPVAEPDRAQHLAIDIGGLLAAAQIFHRLAAQLRRDAERDAAAGAAAVEPQYKAGLFRRSAMIER